jgi:hypothetical protein
VGYLGLDHEDDVPISTVAGETKILIICIYSTPVSSLVVPYFFFDYFTLLVVKIPLKRLPTSKRQARQLTRPNCFFLPPSTLSCSLVISSTETSWNLSLTTRRLLDKHFSKLPYIIARALICVRDSWTCLYYSRNYGTI